MLDSGGSWGPASAPIVQPDASPDISCAPNNRTPPQAVEVRQEEGGLRLLNREAAARPAPAGPGARPPFSEVSTREISSFTRDGRDEVERSAWARPFRPSSGRGVGERAPPSVRLAARWWRSGTRDEEGWPPRPPLAADPVPARDREKSTVSHPLPTLRGAGRVEAEAMEGRPPGLCLTGTGRQRREETLSAWEGAQAASEREPGAQGPARLALLEER